MAQTTVSKLLDAHDPDSVKLWADKVYIALQDLLGVTPSSSTTTSAAVGIKSIQRGTISLSGAATTGTSTITSVDTTKTELRYLGSDRDNADVVLTNATTVTATRQSTTGTTIVSWELTEYE